MCHLQPINRHANIVPPQIRRKTGQQRHKCPWKLRSQVLTKPEASIWWTRNRHVAYWSEGLKRICAYLKNLRILNQHRSTPQQENSVNHERRTSFARRSLSVVWDSKASLFQRKWKCSWSAGPSPIARCLTGATLRRTTQTDPINRSMASDMGTQLF